MRPRVLIIAAAGLALAGVAWAQGGGRSAEQRAAAFDMADADHDGYLTPDEFLDTPRGQAPNNPIANWLVSDKDKDGRVSKKEFVEPMIGEDPGGPPAPPPKP